MDLVALAPRWAILIFVALLLLAALQDLVQLKISNVLCGALLLLVVVVAVTVGLTASGWQNLAAFVAVLGIGTWLFSRELIGGGDVKLLAVTVPWFDLAGQFRLLVAIAICGGLLALLIIVARKIPLRPTVRPRIATLQPKAGIPYGVAIAAGAILTVLLMSDGRIAR